MARLNMYKNCIFLFFNLRVITSWEAERECSEMAARYDKAFLMTSHCMMQTTSLTNLLSLDIFFFFLF